MRPIDERNGAAPVAGVKRWVTVVAVVWSVTVGAAPVVAAVTGLGAVLAPVVLGRVVPGGVVLGGVVLGAVLWGAAAPRGPWPPGAEVAAYPVLPLGVGARAGESVGCSLAGSGSGSGTGSVNGTGTLARPVSPGAAAGVEHPATASTMATSRIDVAGAGATAVARPPIRPGPLMAPRCQSAARCTSTGTVEIVSNVPDIILTGGVAMPQLGFGVWQVPDDEAVRAVGEALRVGYRSIDTAALYRNESGVGRALADSGLARDEVFVTTKLGNPDHGYDAALRAFAASLQRLGTEYVDLYLIHWPQPKRDKYVDTWRALQQIRADGRARAIGVSNFTTAHLRRLLDETDIVPAVNQIELHPYLAQPEMRAFHAEHGIATEAWSPLGQGGDLLRDPVITSLALKYGRTPAQIVLRWHLQSGTVAIPKSVTPSRIAENFDVTDFELADDDIAAIDDLDRDGRIGSHPDDVG